MSKIEKITLAADSNNPILLDFSKFKKTAALLRAASHEMREKIIELLSENKELTVTEIYVALRVEQSVASQHLAILRRNKLVDTHRKGKFIHYSLNNKNIESLSVFVDKICS